jgi:bacterioferritin
MRGDEQVIDYLNRALRHELAAVNQYWLHYRILDNWGYKEFAKTWRAESIEEMHHADQLVARILFLDGQPNMQSLDQLRIGRNVKEILECDLAAEMHARDEEKHIDFLEAQLTLVEQLGVQLYAQKHVGELEGD